MVSNAIRKAVLRVCSAILLCYVAAAATMTLMQRSLLYHDAPSSVTPAQAGVPFAQNLHFSSEGQQIQYWWIAPQTGLPTIVYFHGNAGSLAGRAGNIKAFAQRGFGVAIMSYRGFGESSGKPTEQALYADADAFIAHLVQQYQLSVHEIILFGESLGTGVASEMATRHAAAMLVLQAPFSSVRTRAQELYPWLPVRWLLRDRYESKEKMPRIQMPLLLMHGLRDEVIPPQHSLALFEAANEPKKRLLYDTVGHNDFPADTIADQIMQFNALHRQK